MGTQQIVERILSDAQAEAESIIKQAEEKAAQTSAEASLRSEERRKQAEAEMQEKRSGILEKKAALARLDSAKLLLKEKRKVVDAVYDEAHSRLLELSKENTVSLINTLLMQYAEDGDELFFAKNFAYCKDVELLPVIKQKGLVIAEEKKEIDGGIWLKGKISDKNLSYSALLEMDKEAHQTELIQELFK